MAAVGITSPPAPSAFASAASLSSSSSSSSTRLRLRPLSDRIAAAASFRARCAAAAASPDGLAEFEGNPDAGTDVAGGATTSTRPPYSLISADNVQKAMRGLGALDFLVSVLHIRLNFFTFLVDSVLSNVKSGTVKNNFNTLAKLLI
jgi:NAD(P)H-quinone oxidoreductase subunit U, chloroplastic